MMYKFFFPVMYNFKSNRFTMALVTSQGVRGRRGSSGGGGVSISCTTAQTSFGIRDLQFVLFFRKCYPDYLVVFVVFTAVSFASLFL